MTTAECEQAYGQLVLAINKAGLPWLTNQVAEEIRFGKTLTKRVVARRDVPDDLMLEGLTEGPRRSRVTVAATRQFTSHEKLSVLLDALEQAVVATHDMEGAVVRYISEAAEDWASIRLVRTDESTREPIQLLRHPDEKRAENVLRLRHLIQSLREEMQHG
jgi:hypothetical protein